VGEPRAIGLCAHGEIRQLVYAPEWIVNADEPTPVPALPPEEPAGSRARAAAQARRHFEGLFARGPDPWRYTSCYEQLKYEQTLALLPEGRIERALEIACAEGIFTRQLASRVESLLAVDLSRIALERAAQRCRGLDHVRFAPLDLRSDELPGPFAAIVCSEVLYYLDGVEALRAVAHKLAHALRPGGRLVTAHAHLVVDDPDQPGFDWDLPFGARVIGEALAAAPGLELVAETRTPLYRVQAFARRRPRRLPWPRPALRGPERTVLAAQPTPVPPEVASQVLGQGGAPAPRGARPQPCRLPILAYHRVAPQGGAALARWRVAPQAFEEQLRYLRESGYRTLDLRAALARIGDRRALPGPAVILSFDDAYLDFHTHARPLLQRYGFQAIVFAVSELVGKTNVWDHGLGEELPLMDWTHLHELRDAGFAIGSHSATHAALSALSPEQIVREAASSRATLARRLACPIDAFAYPYGDCDAAVAHLVGACGYRFGLTLRSGAVQASDDLLALPRIEVQGGWTFAQFVAALQADAEAPPV
jgi:peptidoglycan/xylan/chitin deacetylase (PgdA/CDA1 family)/SAM-dependent methyltransferase